MIPIYHRLKHLFSFFLLQRVLVVAHHDVDAVCASQILLYLFQCDEIMHSMVSIRSADELQSVLQEYRTKVCRGLGSFHSFEIFTSNLCTL